MSYVCLQQEVYHYSNYSVVPLRKCDIFDIMKWRNAQMDVLRQNEILTEESQKAYYESVVKRSFLNRQPRIILFSFLLNGDCIGYGGLTNIEWSSKRVELSFLLDNSRINSASGYRRDFSIFITLMKKVAFEDLKMNKMFTETYDIRSDHIRILEDNGFELEGRLKEHVIISNQYVDSLMHGCLRRARDVV